MSKVETTTTQEVKPLNAELILYRLDEIKEQLSKIDKEYVTKDEFAAFQKAVQKELKAKSISNWINPIVASASTAIVVFLLVYFFNNVNKG